MYVILYSVGRAGSHVMISQSIFGFNNATDRGGVIAIINRQHFRN